MKETGGGPLHRRTPLQMCQQSHGMNDNVIFQRLDWSVGGFHQHLSAHLKHNLSVLLWQCWQEANQNSENRGLNNTITQLPN